VLSDQLVARISRREQVGAERGEPEVMLQRMPVDIGFGNGRDLVETPNREAH